MLQDFEVGSLFHYFFNLQGYVYIPGGAGVPPSTVWNWDGLKTHDASQPTNGIGVIAFGYAWGSMPRAPNMFCVFFFHPAGRLPGFFECQE